MTRDCGPPERLLAGGGGVVGEAAPGAGDARHAGGDHPAQLQHGALLCTVQLPTYCNPTVLRARHTKVGQTMEMSNLLMPPQQSQC